MSRELVDGMMCAAIAAVVVMVGLVTIFGLGCYFLLELP